MSRINLDPLMTFPDGSHLVVSTQCSKAGDFSCALYNAVVAEDDRVAFQIVSSHLDAATCLGLKNMPTTMRSACSSVLRNDKEAAVSHLARSSNDSGIGIPGVCKRRCCG